MNNSFKKRISTNKLILIITQMDVMRIYIELKWHIDVRFI